jgi:hypothetical protein
VRAKGRRASTSWADPVAARWKPLAPLGAEGSEAPCLSDEKRDDTRRFATTAPLWLGALTGCTPLPPGVTRRLASGALRYFLDGGTVDGRGLLPLGRLGPDESLVQDYSGPASPGEAAAFVDDGAGDPGGH